MRDAASIVGSGAIIVMMVLILVMVVVVSAVCLFLGIGFFEFARMVNTMPY